MFSKGQHQRPQGESIVPKLVPAESISLTSTPDTSHQERFVRDVKASKLPRKRDAAGNMNPNYQAAVIKLHGAILGITALSVSIGLGPFDVAC